MLSPASAGAGQEILLVRRREGQRSSGIGSMRRIVRRVPISVVDDHFKEIEGRDTFQAGDVDSKLVGVRSALVVGVDAATLTEMMFCGLRVEPIGGQLVLALEDFEILRR